MTQRRTLSLALGAFRCEISGYDDPFAILGRVVELFSETAPAAEWMAASGGPRGAELRARFAGMLREEAARFDADIAAGPDDARIARRPAAAAADAATAADDARPGPAGAESAARPALTPSQVMKAPPGLGPELERMRARFAREEAEDEARRARRAPPPPAGERSLFDDAASGAPPEEETLILSRADRAPRRTRE